MFHTTSLSFLQWRRISEKKKFNSFILTKKKKKLSKSIDLSEKNNLIPLVSPAKLQQQQHTQLRRPEPISVGAYA